MLFCENFGALFSLFTLERDNLFVQQNCSLDVYSNFIGLTFHIYLFFCPFSNIDVASNSHSKNQYSAVQKIPIRATVISALSVIPQVVVITVELASGLDKEDIGMGNRLVMLLFSLIRCPLIGNTIYHCIHYNLENKKRFI